MLSSRAHSAYGPKAVLPDIGTVPVYKRAIPGLYIRKQHKLEKIQVDCS